jgi:hypothetical protein
MFCAEYLFFAMLIDIFRYNFMNNSSNGGIFSISRLNVSLLCYLPFIVSTDMPNFLQWMRGIPKNHT